jgi:hypothetical protein
MEEPLPWHRLFGLSWTDLLRDQPVVVDMEKDLSHKQQLLDVVLIRKEAAVLTCPLPDGFDDLATHNLISFKSYQESLDGWALNELVGHYVNYRKQVSPSMQELLPESDFRLYAVTVRFPANLGRRGELRPIQDGVYEVWHFTGPVRVVVVHELPQEEHNALLHLFSAKLELFRYGAAHYQQHSDETSTLFYRLFQRYQWEETLMPGIPREFVREAIEEILKDMPPEELRQRLSPEQRIEGLSAEERLKGLPAEERLKGLSPEELLAALPPETREALARRLKNNGSSSNPE